MTESEEQKVFLKTFVDENDKLLTTLSVFVALTAFFSQLEVKMFGAILSTITLTASMLLWFELWETFPSKKGTQKLIWFENILSIGMLTFFVYWMYTVESLFEGSLIVILSSIILWPISNGIKRLDLFNHLFQTEPGKKKFLRHAVGWVIIIFVYFVCMQIASLIYPNLVAFFKKIPATTDFGGVSNLFDNNSSTDVETPSREQELR